MRIKRNNLHFMLFTLLFMELGFVVALTNKVTKISGWGLESVIPYLILIGIGLLMMRKDEATFFDVLPFNVGVKPLTVLLTVVLVFTLSPFAIFLSAVGSLLGGGDVLSGLIGLVMKPDMGVFEKFFIIAVVPAIFEEVFFRGFFYAGFKRARGARLAIILTGILFGFVHGVLQQVIYASVLGIVLAILREVTGSMWTGILYHLVNNGYSVILSAIVGEATLAKFPLERLKFFMTDGNTAGNLIFSYGIMVAGLVLSGFILYLIIKREGRLEDAKHFFKRPEDPKEKIVTVPFVIGCVKLGAYAVLMAVAGKSIAAVAQMASQAVK